ncbi:MAG: hypothetical protein J3R72DRAFT_455035, partial [Linnemannia gamsii]
MFTVMHGQGHIFWKGLGDRSMLFLGKLVHFDFLKLKQFDCRHQHNQVCGRNKKMFYVPCYLSSMSTFFFLPFAASQKMMGVRSVIPAMVAYQVTHAWLYSPQRQNGGMVDRQKDI